MSLFTYGIWEKYSIDLSSYNDPDSGGIQLNLSYFLIKTYFVDTH